mmetsp:Transcript_16580/g.24944  ORF Transcript_16580/g.24944 Transcript_16580/m.24944 type:complete len:89 (-) Transcript_16580:1866-2132(-)
MHSYYSTTLINHVQSVGDNALSVHHISHTGVCIIIDISGYTSYAYKHSHSTDSLHHLHDVVNEFLSMSADTVYLYGGDGNTLQSCIYI